MYINSVLSSMGAWRDFTEQHASIFATLEEALSTVEEETFANTGDQAVGRLHQALNEELEKRGWSIGTQVRLVGGKRTFYTLDFLKERIGGKLILGKPAFILSSLLANFPLSMRIHDIDLGFVLVPMQSLKDLLPRGVSDFESTERVLEELAPLLIRYPFLIIGFSSDPFPLDVTELTSELDQFLLAQSGYTLNEMAALGEKPGYDFKMQLPEKIERVTKEVCDQPCNSPSRPFTNAGNLVW